MIRLMFLSSVLVTTVLGACASDEMSAPSVTDAPGGTEAAPAPEVADTAEDPGDASQDGAAGETHDVDPGPSDASDPGPSDASDPGDVAPAPPRVALETSLGTIVLALDATAAPSHVANFLAYVDAGFYDDTLFHRVLTGSLVQGGRMGSDGVDKAPSAPVANESDNGLRNVRGTLAAARKQDPDSATSQFFINVADNTYLDFPNQGGSGYTVFGRVAEGLDVVDAIAAVTVNSSVRPTDNVVLVRASRR